MQLGWKDKLVFNTIVYRLVSKKDTLFLYKEVRFFSLINFFTCNIKKNNKFPLSGLESWKFPTSELSGLPSYSNILFNHLLFVHN